jgi:hypothetical protein
MPEECRLLRPDLVVQNPPAKKIYSFEFACPFAKIYQNGDALKYAYDCKEGKYARLCERARFRYPANYGNRFIIGRSIQRFLETVTSVMELSPA